MLPKFERDRVDRLQTWGKNEGAKTSRRKECTKHEWAGMVSGLSVRHVSGHTW